MQKQGKRASAEQNLQVVGAGKAGENDQEYANSNPGIETTARIRPIEGCTSIHFFVFRFSLSMTALLA